MATHSSIEQSKHTQRMFDGLILSPSATRSVIMTCQKFKLVVFSRCTNVITPLNVADQVWVFSPPCEWLRSYDKQVKTNNFIYL